MAHLRVSAWLQSEFANMADQIFDVVIFRSFGRAESQAFPHQIGKAGAPVPRGKRFRRNLAYNPQDRRAVFRQEQIGRKQTGFFRNVINQFFTQVISAFSCKNYRSCSIAKHNSMMIFHFHIIVTIFYKVNIIRHILIYYVTKFVQYSFLNIIF